MWIMTEKYKVELTKDQIRKLIDLCDFSFEKLRPFIPIELIRAQDIFKTIIQSGCFKHNRIRVKFQTSPDECTILCPQCNPKEYKDLKSKYKEKQI